MPHRPGPPWGDGHPWGHDWGAGGWGAGGPFLSILTTLWWLLLLAGLAWLAWWWLSPHLRPWLSSLFAHEPATPSATAYLNAVQNELNTLVSADQMTQDQASQLYTQEQTNVNNGQYTYLQSTITGSIGRFGACPTATTSS